MIFIYVKKHLKNSLNNIIIYKWNQLELYIYHLAFKKITKNKQVITRESCFVH